MVLVAAQVCDEKKGTDTRILELDPADAGFTDFFLITSGSNTRQTGAIADEIEMRMKREFGTYAKSVEGRRSGEWILLDYIDFVVHIFTEQTREFYDIERLRKSARPVDTDELTAELKHRTEAARKKAPAKAPAKKATAKKAAGKALSPGTELAVDDAAEHPAAPAKKTAKKAARKAPAKKAMAKKAPAKQAAKHMAKSGAKTPRSRKVEDLALRALPVGAPIKNNRRLPAPSSDK